jgi:hypothetical protein
VESAAEVGLWGGEEWVQHRGAWDSWRAYRACEIDALVAQVIPEDAWYLFPVRVARRIKSSKLSPGNRRRRSKFEKWREAWWVVGRGGG